MKERRNSDASVIAEILARNNSSQRNSQLYLAGFSQNKLSQYLNISVPMVSLVIANKRNTRWIRHALAQLAGVSYSDFWGCEQPELSEADVEKLRARGLIDAAVDAGDGGRDE